MAPLFIALASGLAVSPAAAQDRETVLKGAPWTAYKVARKGRRVCYIEASPQKKRGAVRKRADPYVQVLHRVAARGRRRDVVEIGFSLDTRIKTKGPVLIVVGRSQFRLVPRENRAFAPSLKENRRLLRAMIRGKVLILRSLSATGERFEDTYGLMGFTKAYYAARAACGLKVPRKSKKGRRR